MDNCHFFATVTLCGVGATSTDDRHTPRLGDDWGSNDDEIQGDIVSQMDDLHSIWNKALLQMMARTANDFSSASALTPRQTSWLRAVRPIQFANGFALLEAPNTYAKEAIETTLHTSITEALHDVLGQSVVIAVKIAENDPATDDAPAQNAGVGTENSASPANSAGGSPDDSSTSSLAGSSANPSTSVASGDHYENDPWPRPPVVDSTTLQDNGLHRDNTAQQGNTTHQNNAASSGASASSARHLSENSSTASHTEPSITPSSPAGTQDAGQNNGQTSGKNSQASGRHHADNPQRQNTTAQQDPLFSEDDMRTASLRAKAPQAAGHTAGTLTDSAGEPTLNARYTFENYVTGGSNQFASAAALAISENPGRSYNPLFIWGGSGLGKTHLLHAVGHYTQQLFPRLKVRYVSTEEFTNDFINSLRDDRKSSFKRRYRSQDVLLVDDIQFLEGKEGIQEEFFYTFEALHNANKQIVICSDRPPSGIATLEDRLRTRFEGGLITDIKAPDLETRVAILKKKAQMENITVPNRVLQLIAEIANHNIRELEGALIRVTAHASFTNSDITEELARKVLDHLPDDATRTPTAQDIMKTVALYYQTSVAELCGNSRARRLAQARQIAMYLCRELTDMSLPKIGATFGGRDHTTVMYAERKINDLIQNNHTLFEEVQTITSDIRDNCRS